MQKIAAYRLEHEIRDDDVPAVEVEAIRALLNKWLVKKGADDSVAAKGSFLPERSGSSGVFERQEARYEDRSWEMLRLTEELTGGRRFETSISVTNTKMSLVIYVTLASGLVSSAVTPIHTDAKCPLPVRWILDMHGPWFHGATKIHGLRRFEGRERGRELAEEVRAATRTLPLVVISEDDGEQTLLGLDKKLSRALLGLANVSVVDDGASWGLTDILGKENSCYWGAVRIFWPHFEENRHHLWRVRRLVDGGATADSFGAQLRSHVMRVSALSTVRPMEINEIRGEANRARIHRLQENLSASEEWEGYAKLWEQENDDLRKEIAEIGEENARLRKELQKAETRLDGVEEAEVQPDSPKDVDDGPRKGDTRYYKKTGSSRKFDKMEETTACNHSAWQSANKADKAKKSIERYVGRKGWKSIHHCGSCTGGGMWKVVW